MSIPKFFDEESHYNRFRDSYAENDKIRGLFHLLKYRNKQEPNIKEPVSELPSQSEESVPQAAHVPLTLAAADENNNTNRHYVLKFIATEIKSTSLRDENINLSVQKEKKEREIDDTFSIWIEGIRPEWIEQKEQVCRVLFLAKTTLERLRDNILKGHILDDHSEKRCLSVNDLNKVDDVLVHAISDEFIDKNLKVIQTFSAIADIDNTVDDTGVINCEVPIPKESPDFPINEYHIVVVLR